METSATLSRGIDAFSFSCAGAPAFSFSSASWEYETYTWHTDVDTFDKVVIDDVRSNAIVLANAGLFGVGGSDASATRRSPTSFDSLPRAGTTFALRHAGCACRQHKVRWASNGGLWVQEANAKT